MARLTLLLTLVALALPGAALAASGADRDAVRRSALATERYYMSYGTNPAPVVTAAPAVSSSHSGPSWTGAGALGAALVLLAGGLGAYGARTLRPRGLGV
jgi:hypothetical protein